MEEWDSLSGLVGSREWKLFQRYVVSLAAAPLGVLRNKKASLEMLRYNQGQLDQLDVMMGMSPEFCVAWREAKLLEMQQLKGETE